MNKVLSTFVVLICMSLCCMAENYPSVKYGPWVQNVTETGFTVIWKSSAKELAFVEVAPDDGTPFEVCPRERFYNVVAGRRVADFFHTVRVTDLQPGKSYRYRIYSRVVENDDNAYAVDYGPCRVVYSGQQAVIKTIDRNAAKCSFIMLNDIHGNDEKYKALVKGVDKSRFDFLMMNGDMVSYINDEDDMLAHVFHVVPELTSSLPTMYSRGNHETRGRNAHCFGKYCPTYTGQPYYMFRQGPVAFLVLDGGEDKPDSSPEYSGAVEFDAFRTAELEWLNDVVKEPLFADAPVKVAVMHIPALKTSDSWYAQSWLNENFLPVLNDAGLDVMLSGHHHNHIHVKVGECGNDFPIIANDDTDRLEFEADADGWKVNTYDMDGRLTHSYDCR